MSQSISTGSVSITGSVAVGAPSGIPAGSTWKMITSGTTPASNAAVLYTVTAGKTFYITSASFGLSGAGYGGFAIGGTNVMQLPVAAGNAGQQYFFNGGGQPLFVATSTQQITALTNAGASTLSYTLFGYEM